jgi:hypothetical protein
MALNSQHVTGFVVGLGAAGLGFYVYKKNQKQIDEFLKSQGINLPNIVETDFTELTLEELVAEKERLEDLIAERDMESKKEE